MRYYQADDEVKPVYQKGRQLCKLSSKNDVGGGWSQYKSKYTESMTLHSIPPFIPTVPV